MKKVSRKKTTKPAGKKLSTVLRESSALAPTATLPPKDRQVARLVRDLGQMIESARQQVAVTANAALTSLYWQLGQHVRTKVLEGRRGEYGAQIVAAVGRQLETRYAKGFGDKNLQRMVQFATVFSDPEIVAALRRQLGWTRFKLLIPLKEGLKREFYAEMCRIEGWSTRKLVHRL